MSTRRARHLPRHQGPAAWAAILPDARPPQGMESDQTADIAVTGAGFAGLSAARHLTQLDPKLRITVLDAGAIAQGAAGRNSGFMIDLPHELASEDYAGAGDDRQIIDLNRMAQDFARRAVADYAIDPAYFDPVGKVNGAASPSAMAQNDSYSAHLEGLGEPSERLDEAQMFELTGSRYYSGGLFTPGTIMLQPAGYIRGLASGLRAEGVQIFENTPALAFTRQTGGWRIETPNHILSCNKIILAVNGHLESFGYAQNRLMHIFLTATMTPELDPRQIGGAPRWGITPSDPMGTTMRRIDTRQGGNRIITRTCAVLRSGMAARQSDLARAGHVMQRKFEVRFPQFPGLQMQYLWAGHLCLSRNSVAVAREIEKGVYSACVQNGLGTARGTLTGMAAAERALGHSSPITAFFDREPQPSRLPPRPVRDPAANALLRWKEWKARAE